MISELTPKQLLDLLFDASSYGDKEAFLQRFSPYLVKGFNPVWFARPAYGRANKSRVVIQRNIAKSIISNDYYTPWLVYFIKEETGWKLHSINEICMTCDGRGILSDNVPEICPGCGGSGWGILGDFDICIASGKVVIEE
jgi:hypothetical protein